MKFPYQFKVLDEKGKVAVSPNRFALAFLSWDLEEITRILSEEVFTQNELDARNASSVREGKIAALDFTKRNSVASNNCPIKINSISLKLRNVSSYPHVKNIFFS
jgi:hypothetical protein